MSTSKPPNVLFILCDDLNDAIEGLGGHPQTRTPNVTRLMQRGVTFTNGHCNAPICAPSRDSLWSGLLPQTARQFGFDHWTNNPVLRCTTMMQTHPAARESVARDLNQNLNPTSI